MQDWDSHVTRSGMGPLPRHGLLRMPCPTNCQQEVRSCPELRVTGTAGTRCIFNVLAVPRSSGVWKNLEKLARACA
jgi:hypothetical protein